PGPLRELAGVWVEEIDALAPEQKNKAVFVDGSEAECGLVCDLMHLEGAESLADYGKDFYAGMPAVTKNTVGNGAVFYVGTRLSKDGLDRVLGQVVKQADVTSVIAQETELEVVCRETQSAKFYFVMNFKDGEYPVPACFTGKTDLLTNEVIKEGEILKKYEVRLVKM
ncbi:MAG: beta-galactosidase trimerization domain-containing protein, partial [Lachnospiraceae bacterium]|nr:beta-galactosidase trimerization domain-containing protein [Lachnospiraceae bacterium]